MITGAFSFHQKLPEKLGNFFSFLFFPSNICGSEHTLKASPTWAHFRNHPWYYLNLEVMCMEKILFILCFCFLLLWTFVNGFSLQLWNFWYMLSWIKQNLRMVSMWLFYSIFGTWDLVMTCGLFFFVPQMCCFSPITPPLMGPSSTSGCSPELTVSPCPNRWWRSQKSQRSLLFCLDSTTWGARARLAARPSAAGPDGKEKGPKVTARTKS